MIERRAIYYNLENKINSFTWPGENFIHKNNHADRKLQKVTGQWAVLNFV